MHLFFIMKKTILRYLSAPDLCGKLDFWFSSISKTIYIFPNETYQSTSTEKYDDLIKYLYDKIINNVCKIWSYFRINEPERKYSWRIIHRSFFIRKSVYVWNNEAMLSEMMKRSQKMPFFRWPLQMQCLRGCKEHTNTPKYTNFQKHKN